MNDDMLNKFFLRPSSMIIGVLSGKGGVGKSTITAEIASALIEEGYRVGVLDADIYGPSIRHLLPEEEPPKVVGEKIAPARCRGISVMSSAYFPKRKGPSGVRAPIANQIIVQFIEEVEWGELDILLVDFPPGTGDVQITLMQKLIFNGALMVTTPEELSLLDVRKSMEMCLQMGVPLLGVIENMSYYAPFESDERHYLFGKEGGKSLAKEFDIPLLAEIPIDQGLNQSKLAKSSLPLFKKLGRKVINALKEEKGYKIKGIDRYHFSIEWLDGKKSLYQFSEVQGKCPCIECTMKNEKPALDVEGLEMTFIGNYGVQFGFSQGCSKGIYPFSYLRKLDR